MNTNFKMYFEISERKILLRFFDVFFVLLGVNMVGRLFDFNYFTFSMSNFHWVIVLGIYINFFGAIFEMFNLQVASDHFQSLKSTVLTATTTVFFYLITPVFSPNLPTKRIRIFLFYLTVLTILLSWRMFYVYFLASKRFSQNVILVCNRDQVEELVVGLGDVDPNYNIVGYVSCDDTINFLLADYVKKIDFKEMVSFIGENSVTEVIVATQSSAGITSDIYDRLLGLLHSGISIREYTQVYESKTLRIPVQYISRDFYKFFPFSRSNNNKLYLTITRFFEIAISLLGIAIGVALVPFVLLGNKIANKGKLFYTQERVGKDGLVFEIYKFRTMIQDSEKNGAVFSTTNDSRITSFGKFMRKTRIDEFPQFVNILLGDMAVIGPRPERPYFVKEIAAIMPFYTTRHVIKPGLTGWAQVSYSYGESIEDSLIKLQYDLYYIKHRSVYLDLSIVFKTISTVLFYKGQ
jgi:exopolysaccharide biosynthesis polyprenyl glycosylphosphotransferase